MLVHNLLPLSFCPWFHFPSCKWFLCYYVHLNVWYTGRCMKFISSAWNVELNIFWCLIILLQKMVNGGTVNNWICINFSRQVQDSVALRFCYELSQMCYISGMVRELLWYDINVCDLSFVVEQFYFGRISVDIHPWYLFHL